MNAHSTNTRLTLAIVIALLTSDSFLYRSSPTSQAQNK